MKAIVIRRSKDEKNKREILAVVVGTLEQIKRYAQDQACLSDQSVEFTRLDGTLNGMSATKTLREDAATFEGKNGITQL